MAHITDPTKEMEEFLGIFTLPLYQYLNNTMVGAEEPPRNVLKEFLIVKRSEGRSIETVKSYFSSVKSMLYSFQDKPLNDLDASDIKAFLMHYQEMHHVSNGSLDNMRRNLNSFFNYLICEDYIAKNPMLKVGKIKYDSLLQLPFTEEELEKIRDACNNIRELALIDFLYSTGVRVSECVRADIHDFNFYQQEGIIYGKGRKERIVYLDTRAKIHLEKYLKTRNDPDPALFVRPMAPHIRLTKAGIEYIVKRIGDRAHVEHVHPHRFRRTLATRLLGRGMPVDQVQVILGHSKIDTTLLYAKVNQMNVKLNHSKYV